MATPIFFQKLERITTNVYSADFASFGASSAEELVGMAVSIAPDPQDLSTTKAVPYLGTGKPAGWISFVTENPSGYQSSNATWKTNTATVELASLGCKVLAKAAVTAGAYLKYDTSAPVGVVVTANAADAVGQAAAPAQANDGVDMIIIPGFTQV